MKRFFWMILTGMLCLSMLSGCSDAQTDSGLSGATEDIDIVDLTMLSSTMVYAEVNNMLTAPEEYVGKTVKVRGLYYANNYPDQGICYHFVVIEDSSACCSQGLEFILTGTHSDPEDYPDDQTLVEITGVWGVYEEDGNPYYYLATDEIVIV